MSANFELENMQRDFGGFNPRFLGVTIEFETQKSFNLFQAYLSNTAPANATAPDAAVGSVIDHETRHYRDFLLSPYGSSLFRLRLQAVLNGVQTLKSCGAVEGNCLPMPLRRWMFLTDGQRAKQQSDWEPEWCAVPVPFYSAEQLRSSLRPEVRSIAKLPAPEQFQRFLEAATHGYLGIEDLVRGHGPINRGAIRPSNFYEVTAYTVQAQALWQGEGEQCASWFMNEFLGRSDRGYAELWRYFAHASSEFLLGVPEKVDGDAIMRMAVWCLLGNYKLDGASACPTVRFTKLFEYLIAQKRTRGKKRTRSNATGSISELWDQWDRETGVAPWRLALQESLSSNRQWFDSFADRLLKLWEGDKSIPEAVSRSMRRFVSDQEIVVRHLLDEPECLVSPHRYLNSDLGLPFPLLNCVFSNFAIALPKAKQPGMPVRSVDTFESDGRVYSRRLLISPTTSQDGEEFFNDMLLVESLMKVCDFMFSEYLFPRDDDGSKERELIEKFSNKRSVPVF